MRGAKLRVGYFAKVVARWLLCCIFKCWLADVVLHTHTHTHTHAGDTDKMGTRQTGFAMQARAFGFN